MKKNVLIVSGISHFEKNLIYCLKENLRYNFYQIVNVFSPEAKVLLTKKRIDIVIYNFLQSRNKVKSELKELLKIRNIQKIIFLENALDFYKNTQSPFSVFNNLIPQNKKGKQLFECEKLIKKYDKEFVFYRVSEIYGPNVDFGIIHKLLNEKELTIPKGKRDFLYEGDFINAIEIALDCDMIGIFNVAFGTSMEMKEVVKEIKKLTHNNINIKWKSYEKIKYEYENLNFYNWKPLVPFNLGLKVKTRQKSII